MEGILTIRGGRLQFVHVIEASVTAFAPFEPFEAATFAHEGPQADQGQEGRYNQSDE